MIYTFVSGRHGSGSEMTSYSSLSFILELWIRLSSKYWNTIYSFEHNSQLDDIEVTELGTPVLWNNSTTTNDIKPWHSLGSAIIYRFFCKLDAMITHVHSLFSLCILFSSLVRDPERMKCKHACKINYHFPYIDFPPVTTGIIGQPRFWCRFHTVWVCVHLIVKVLSIGEKFRWKKKDIWKLHSYMTIKRAIQ